MSTQGETLPLARAQVAARRLTEWLAPFCDRIETAGSIRRGRPVCGDVDLVIVPRFAIAVDMFGEQTGCVNTCSAEIQRRIKAEGWALSSSGPESLVFVGGGIQVDVWFAGHDTFGSVWLCRTGSREHNVALCQRALALGGRWTPNRGVLVNGAWHRATTEADIYTALGLPFIAPEAREEAHVRRIMANSEGAKARSGGAL